MTRAYKSDANRERQVAKAIRRGFKRLSNSMSDEPSTVIIQLNDDEGDRFCPASADIRNWLFRKKEEAS
jgi:hypothetical protein